MAPLRSVVEEAPLSYDTLLDLLRVERRSNKLAELPKRFWEDVRHYLQDSEAQFRKEQEKDPFSKRVRMLTDEVIHARDAADALWALRERKIAMQALAHARLPDEAKGMLPSEQPVYDDVLRALKENRERVFGGTVAAPKARADARGPVPTPRPEAPRAAAPEDGTSQETGPPRQPREAPSGAAPTTSAAEATPDAPDAKPRDTTPALGEQEESAPTAASTARPDAPLEEQDAQRDGGDEARPSGPVTVPSDTPHTDAVTIRAKGDIPPFVGPDMQTYLLKDGDIATVPKSIADLLVRRQKAAVVEEALA